MQLYYSRSILGSVQRGDYIYFIYLYLFSIIVNITTHSSEKSHLILLFAMTGNREESRDKRSPIQVRPQVCMEDEYKLGYWGHFVLEIWHNIFSSIYARPKLKFLKY